MKKICFVGHLGFGKKLLNGQTIKTKTILDELINQFGNNQVLVIDTHGGLKVLPRVFIMLFVGFIKCENIIILPAYNGLRLFAPLCYYINRLFHRRVQYIVIGGWLNDYLNSHKRIGQYICSFFGVYVETNSMKKVLNARGLKNVFVMPNFKNIRILDEKELVYSTEEPYRLCTFSRVMKEKGIESAVNSVKFINEKMGRKAFILDIYGQVDNEQQEWFEELKKNFGDEIFYKGEIDYEKSVDVIKNYYSLLFLTYYSGEGFAGTLLDAMAAGVPIIASEWKYNSEIVLQNRNGVLVEVNNQNAINDVLEQGLICSFNDMKLNCIKMAESYMPNKAIRILLSNL